MQGFPATATTLERAQELVLRHRASLLQDVMGTFVGRLRGTEASSRKQLPVLVGVLHMPSMWYDIFATSYGIYVYCADSRECWWKVLSIGLTPEGLLGDM